ncbi:MAG: glycosyltransferase family 9 protein [Oligoflexia bacterium]|nr:glycosyltransferase family 9 protein [Oligoflexia bacterium]
MDGWIGGPLAWLLGRITRRPRCFSGDRPATAVPKKVICSKFIGLGGVVLCLPLFRALKDSGARIAFWSFEGQAEIAKLSGLVDEVWIIRPTFFGFLPSLWSSWWRARRFKAEAFIDLEPTANLSAVLGRLTGARTRVGFLSGKPSREQLFTHLVAHSSARHTIENHLRCGEVLGLPRAVNSELPSLPTLDHIPNILPVLSHRRRIVININSSDPAWQKIWCEDHWVELCNSLLRDFRVDLIFPGTAEEQSRVQGIIARLKDPMRVFNLAGKTYLVEALRLLKDSELAVSVDSGLMHLAAWAGTPLIALFGPESPIVNAPRAPKSRVLWASLPCSPCLSASAKLSRCQDNRCMKTLAPEQVLQACRLYLEPSVDLSGDLVA